MNLTEEQRAYIFSQVNPATGRNFAKGERLKAADVERLLMGFTPAAKQAADTAQAQSMLGSLQVATPSAAATQPQQSTAGYPTDFRDLNLRREPIDAVVQEVDQRAAAEQAAPEPEPAQQAGLNFGALQGVLNARQVELNRVAPVEKARYRSKEVETQLQKETVRLSNNFIKTSRDLSAFGIQDENTFNALAAEPFEVRAKAQRIVEEQMARGETPSWLDAVQRIKEPAEQKTADGKPVNERAVALYEIEKIDETLERTPEGSREAEILLGQRQQKIGQFRGMSTPQTYVEDLGNFDKEMQKMQRIGETDPDLDETAGVFNMFTQTPIGSRSELEAYKGQLQRRRNSTLVDIELTPESWSFLPGGPEKFKSGDDFLEFEKGLAQGTPYRNEAGKFVIKGNVDLNAERAKRGAQTESLSADNPFKDEYETAQEGTKRLNSEVATRKLNFELQAYKKQLAELNDAPAPLGLKTWRANQWEKLSKKISQIESSLNELQGSK